MALPISIPVNLYKGKVILLELSTWIKIYTNEKCKVLLVFRICIINVQCM